MRKQVKVEDLVKDLRKDPSIVDGIRQDILVEKALHEILQAIKGTIVAIILMGSTVVMNNAKKTMMTLAKMMLKAQTKADFYLSNAN